MLVKDVLANTILSEHQLEQLRSECSQFLRDSGSIPLYKNLPDTYCDFQRVKVRQKRYQSITSTLFTEAFDYNNIFNRAVFTSSALKESEHNNVEPFYIFPINGFKFAYNKEVDDSGEKWSSLVETLDEKLGDAEGQQIVVHLLKYTYIKTNLLEGLQSETEIILYNMPYYYAVRKSNIDYQSLLSYL